MPKTISVQQDLEKSQAVIDRLLPLTTPFSGSDQELKEHLVADGKHEDALATWRHLERRFEHVESPAVREWLVRAGMEVIALTVHRGATFARVDMVREADRLEQRFGADAWPATQALVAKIRLRKSELFEDLGYRQQALEGYAQLQSDFQASDADDLREVAAVAPRLRRPGLTGISAKKPALSLEMRVFCVWPGTA